MSRARKVEAAGIAIGLIAAVVCLIGLSIWLLSPEGTSYKVLVAVWLWALPLLGLFALAGWVLGRIAYLITGAER